VAQVEGLAVRQPVLMLFEDAQWSDPTSLELYNLIVDRVSALRVLLIVTFRPEFAPAWIGRPHVTLRALNGAPAPPSPHTGYRSRGGRLAGRVHRRLGSWIIAGICR
jgi:hypothetical protein